MTAETDLLPPSPAAWLFQHEETGRMSTLENDGINTPENFGANNPRLFLCGALYSEPQVRACVSSATEALRAEIEDLKVQVAGLTVEVEHHTAYAITHRGALCYCNSNMRDAYSDEKVRAETAEAQAERLAEALRHLRNHTSVNSHQIELIDAALEQEAGR